MIYCLNENIRAYHSKSFYVLEVKFLRVFFVACGILSESVKTLQWKCARKLIYQRWAWQMKSAQSLATSGHNWCKANPVMLMINPETIIFSLLRAAFGSHFTSNWKKRRTEQQKISCSPVWHFVPASDRGRKSGLCRGRPRSRQHDPSPPSASCTEDFSSSLQVTHLSPWRTCVFC